jgi:hypothetical protein
VLAQGGMALNSGQWLEPTLRQGRWARLALPILRLLMGLENYTVVGILMPDRMPSFWAIYSIKSTTRME